jgi:hypothetical protein
VWNNHVADVNPSGGSSRNLDKDYQKVIELETPMSFNYMDRLKSGMYGSELITYDIMTQQYTHLGYKPVFSEHKHLNANPPWSEKIVARTKSVIIDGRKYYNNFEGFGDVTNTRYIQKRKSLLAQAESYKVIITVFGRSDYSVGQRVLLEVPKTTQIKAGDTDVNDNVMSGVYLIAAICHVVDSEAKSHTCVVELIKESFVVNLNA